MGPLLPRVSVAAWRPTGSGRRHAAALLLAAFSTSSAPAAPPLAQPIRPPAWLLPTPAAQRSETAWVFTARVDDGLHLPLETLVELARRDGTWETLTFDPQRGPEALAPRELLRTGHRAHRYPGFGVAFRELLEANGGTDGVVSRSPDGLRAELHAADDETSVHWTLPSRVGEAPLLVRIDRHGAPFAEIQVHEVRGFHTEAPWPSALRVDLPTRGSTLIQVFDYTPSTALGSSQSAPAHGPEFILRTQGGTRDGAIPPVSRDQLEFPDHAPIPSDRPDELPEDAVVFDYSLSDLNLDFDSLWQPPGNEEPGGWPMQLRFELAGGFDVTSHIDGSLDLDEEALWLGDAEGTLSAVFGAELKLRAALDLVVVDPIIVPVPFVPYFDLLVEDEVSFDSWLLESEVTLSDDARGDLFEAPITGVPWLLEGGVAGKAAVHLDGRMRADSLSTSDGGRFEAEASSQPVRAPDGHYQSEAGYNEYLELDTDLWLFASGYVRVLGMTWHYKLPGGIPWTVTEGQFDIDSGHPTVDFALAPGDRLWRSTISPALPGPVQGLEVGQDGIWLVTGDATPMLMKLSRGGDWIESWEQPADLAEGGWRGLTRAGNRLYAGAGPWIDELEEATGELTGLRIAGPLTDHRALTYDPAQDLFWAAGPADGGGSELVSFDRQGSAVQQFTQDSEITALVWDATEPGHPQLWVAEAGDPTLYAFDPLAGDYTGDSVDWDAAPAGGGLETRRGSWVGVDAGELSSVKITEGYRPDTLYVELLECRVDRSYALAGDPVRVDVKFRLEDTVTPDGPHDVTVVAALAEVDSELPWQESTKTLTGLKAGIHSTRFRFVLDEAAEPGMKGEGRSVAWLTATPEIEDSLSEGHFTVGENPQAGAVTGVLLNSETGRGVAEAAVSLFRGDGNSSGLKGVTDETGAFRIDRVDPGSYYLEWSHPWYADGRHPDVGSLRVAPLEIVDRDSIAIVETGMAYIEIRPESPNRYEVIFFPAELDVNTSFTRNCEYRWVTGLAADPTTGYFFAFEDEELGSSPGYIRVWFDLEDPAAVGDVALRWRGIGKKTLTDNIYAFYKMNDTPIWLARDHFVYESAWVDYEDTRDATHLVAGQNKFHFGATNDTDWSEHIVDTLRWSFHGWHPGDDASTVSRRVTVSSDDS